MDPVLPDVSRIPDTTAGCLPAQGGRMLRVARKSLIGAKVVDIWIDAGLQYLVFDNGEMMKLDGGLWMTNRANEL